LQTKLCPKCKETKPRDEFNRNASRPDGLAYCCKYCRKHGQADYTKRNLNSISKDCLSCGRYLPRKMFYYCQSSDDCLTDICRTCKLHKLRGRPTTEQVEEYEHSLNSIIKSAKEIYHPIGERFLFEEYVFKQLQLQGWMLRWKPPSWLNTKLFKDS
jgi:hypothetical protein